MDRLTQQFTELEGRSGEIRRNLAERNADKAPELDLQFAILSSLLLAGPVENGQPAGPSNQRRSAEQQFA